MKVRFLNALHVEKIDGEDWRLLRDLVVDIDGEILTVPEGFITDFASVPRLPLSYLLAGNTAHAAAVVHDYLYAIRADRAYADRVFRAAMEATDVPAWRRWLMWGAVRIGGGAGYRDHAPADRVFEGPHGA